MKLPAYVETAVQTGHTRFTVASPRGYVLCKGELIAGQAEAIEALCREDAAPLDRGRVHEYALSCESEDGAKASRFTVRVPGGQAPDDEHKVDVASTNTPAAVIGHLTRVVVEQQKALMSVAKDAMALCKGLNEELERTRRKNASLGHHAVTARVIELEHEERREERARWGNLLTEIAGVAKPFAVRALKSAGGPDVGWSEFKASLSDEQLAMVFEVLGQERAARLLAFSSAVAACDFLYDHAKPEELMAISGRLSEPQQALLGASFQERMQQRQAADAAKAEKGEGEKKGQAS